MTASQRLTLLLCAVLLAAGIFLTLLNGSILLPAEKKTRFMMDTYVTITVPGKAIQASRAIDAAFDRMQEISVKFNSLDPKSPIYAFNHNGTPIVDPEVLDVVRRGLAVSEESGGAFDPTVAPLLELWGFYAKDLHLPDAEAVRSALSNVGYRHLVWREGRLDKDAPGVMLDLGGLAKGYALAEAVLVLKGYGVRSALVDAGGDIFAFGRNGLRPWKVGIRDPRGEGLLGYVEVEDAAVLGSGDYERFFIRDGKRYHHIVDPRTGYPTDGVASVTLVCRDPFLGQARSKVPFVLGPGKGMEILEKIPGVDVIIVLTSGEQRFSRGLTHPFHPWRSE
ncbi:MAG: FAD:protein FMN transferase [Candidatus Omnitrophica bacterium]|nr:FAD:protein FMN transferase [Candidatus Omnitrophota bacterium]